MSRVGKKPIPLPKGVKLDIGATILKVEGPRGKLEVPVKAKAAATPNLRMNSRLSVRPEENSDLLFKNLIVVSTECASYQVLVLSISCQYFMNFDIQVTVLYSALMEERYL